MLVVALLGVIAAISIPSFRNYQRGNALQLAVSQVSQGLDRTRRNAITNKYDTVWSFYVPTGELGVGSEYPFTDTAKVETYPMPSDIAVGGYPRLVTFNRLTGYPIATGSLVLRPVIANAGGATVTVDIDKQIGPKNANDLLVLCHYPPPHNVNTRFTMVVASEAMLHAYQQEFGDTFGPCPTGGAVVGLSSSSAPAPVPPPPSADTCSSLFTLGSDYLLQTTASTTLTLKNLEANLWFAPGADHVPIFACYSSNGGVSYSPLVGAGTCTEPQNHGTAMQQNGTDTKVVSLSAGAHVAVRVHGYYTKNNSLSYNETFDSYPLSKNLAHVLYYRNGDVLASYPSYGSPPTSLKDFLTSKGMLDGGGHITIGACETLAVTSLDPLGTQAASFENDVMLLRFQ